MPPKGRCHFNSAWLTMDDFRLWVAAVPGNRFEAFCTVCQKRFDVASGGVSNLKSHAQGKKHKEAIQRRTTSITVDRFFVSGNESCSSATSQAASGIVASASTPLPHSSSAVTGAQPAVTVASRVTRNDCLQAELSELSG